jgi:hypothetical protein
MLAAGLGITYLGAVLCYVASPKSSAGSPARAAIAPRWLRRGGWGLLALGLGLGMTALSMSAGVLVWLSMTMAAFSALVIAGPLVRPFIPITSALALALALIAPWM